jgi:hypothetical protein
MTRGDNVYVMLSPSCICALTVIGNALRDRKSISSAIEGWDIISNALNDGRDLSLDEWGKIEPLLDIIDMKDSCNEGDLIVDLGRETITHA